MADLTCCWTNCGEPQGLGTWTEINGVTLPVCEEHWYGNWVKLRRQVEEEAALLRQRLNEIAALASGEGDRG